MAFQIIPRELKFFDMFEETTAILIRASDRFLDLVQDFEKLSLRTEEIKLEEHNCDESVGRIITALDKTFITPFDREDIHTLATKLDSILDELEETATRFTIFRMTQATPPMIEMARIIRQCTVHIDEAIRLCRSMKNADKIQVILREIGRLENQADALYRDCETELFTNPPDILTLIKLREVYRGLEETVDSCRDVAHVISEIVIKGS